MSRLRKSSRLTSESSFLSRFCAARRARATGSSSPSSPPPSGWKRAEAAERAALSASMVLRRLQPAELGRVAISRMFDL
eukprot:5146491-Prymnesium_polylepis.2